MKETPSASRKRARCWPVAAVTANDRVLVRPSDCAASCVSCIERSSHSDATKRNTSRSEKCTISGASSSESTMAASHRPAASPRWSSCNVVAAGENDEAELGRRHIATVRCAKRCPANCPSVVKKHRRLPSLSAHQRHQNARHQRPLADDLRHIETHADGDEGTIPATRRGRA